MAVDSRLCQRVYVQIGLVLLIALAAKNAILIVRFAGPDRKRDVGGGCRPRDPAFSGGADDRRLALSSGIMPVMLATGAGAQSRRIIGTTVFSGMLVATAIGIVFIPSLFVLFPAPPARMGASADVSALLSASLVLRPPVRRLRKRTAGHRRMFCGFQNEMSCCCRRRGWRGATDSQSATGTACSPP